MKKVVSYLAVLIVSLFTFVGITKAELKIGNIDVSTGTKVVYIGREGCGYCQAFVPGLNYLSEKYGFTYEYVDTDVTSNGDIDLWLASLKVNPDDFGTPTFGVFKNGELVQSHIGFIPENELFTFFQETGVIGSDKTYEPEFKNIKYITDEDYLNIIDSNKKSLVLLSQYTCSQCLSSRGFLDELSTELNVDINYYNLAFKSEEAYNKFAESSKYVKTELEKQTLLTPTFMVIKGNKVRAVLTNYEGKEDVKAFINDYLIGNKIQSEFIEPINYKKIINIIVLIVLVASLGFNVYACIKLYGKKTKKVKKEEPKEIVEEKPVVKKAAKTTTKKTTKKTETKKTNSKK